jgi:hypothetical protein
MPTPPDWQKPVVDVRFGDIDVVETFKVFDMRCAAPEQVRAQRSG